VRTVEIESKKEAVMEERDDWQQPAPGSLAPDVTYEVAPAEVYREEPGSVQAERGTVAPDVTYEQSGPAPRPGGEWVTVEEWLPDTRPSAAAEHPLSGEVVAAPAAVEREGSREQAGQPVTLAAEGLVVSAVIVEAPRSGDRDGPWQRRVPGTIAAEFPRS
jgi:hypothetical protein